MIKHLSRGKFMSLGDDKDFITEAQLGKLRKRRFDYLCWGDTRKRSLRRSIIKEGQKKFNIYDARNSHIFYYFTIFFDELWDRGFTEKMSHWDILNRVRWETLEPTQSEDEFKISNNVFAYYARMFLAVNPQHYGMFDIKPLASKVLDIERKK